MPLPEPPRRSITSGDIAPTLGVEHGRRLVEHQVLGLHGQRAGDGEALLLPAGEQVRLASLETGEPDGRERFVDATTNLRPLQSEVLGSERDVILHGGRHDLVVGMLKHHGHAFSNRRVWPIHRRCRARPP